CSIQHAHFPYPIDRVGGSLELNDDRWLFRNLTGRNDSAVISGEGSWMEVAGRGKELELQFSAADLPLADELREGLPLSQRRLWSNVQSRGNIDRLLVGLHYRAATEHWSVDVEAEKSATPPHADGRPISLEPAWFRYALSNLTGSIRYHDGT